MSTTERTDPGEPRRDEVDHDTVPPARTGLLVLAGVLLAIPIVALLWTSSYSRVEPRLGAFPFFIWYQFVWVFLCSALTYTAYRIVLVARPHRPMTGPDAHHSRAERERAADRAPRDADRPARDDRTGEQA